MSITELGYARFGVSDLEAWRSFVEEYIGLEVHPESEGDRLYLRLDDWHHRIILDKDPADDLIGIGLRVAGAQEFRDLKQTLKDKAGHGGASYSALALGSSEMNL